MTFSIIIPHYNSSFLLEKLLKSIPKEENLEILVIDDKSDDFHKQRYIKMKKENQEVIFLDNNTNKKGAGVCRNIGLQNAKGKWLIFADSDDYFLPTFYKEITKYENSKFDIVYFKSESIELGTGNKSDRNQIYNNLINEFVNNKNKQNELNLRSSFCVPWSKMVKKKLIEEKDIKFSETLVANDVMFSTKVGIYAENITISTNSIYCVTKSDGTLTGQITEDKIKQRFDIFIEHYNFLKENLETEYFSNLNLTFKPYLRMAISNKFSLKFTAFITSEYVKNKINILCIKGGR